jgi:hypothetical protein
MSRGKPSLCLLVATFAVALQAGALDASRAGEPSGFVDAKGLLEIAGEESVSVQLSLHGSLLQALARADGELSEAVSGLESINAVVLSLAEPATAARLKEELASIEQRLRGRGWEPITVVRDGNERLAILVLNDEERIRGLVVLLVEEEELVFANVAGSIDLATLQRVGAELELPGLESLGGD